MASRSKLLCVAFSTALAGGLHALAADLHELQTTLALFFGDVPFGADAARKAGGSLRRFRWRSAPDGRRGDGDDPPVAQLRAREAVRLVSVRANGIVPFESFVSNELELRFF